MTIFSRMFTGRSDKYAAKGGATGELFNAMVPGFRSVFNRISDDMVQMERLARYERNWRAYLGATYNVNNALQSGGGDKSTQKGQTEAKVNSIRVSVDTLNAFCFAKGFEMSLDYAPGANLEATEVKTLRNKHAEMVRFFFDVYEKDNSGDANTLECGLYTAVNGDAVLVATPVMSESLQVTYLADGSAIADKTSATIRLMAVNPMFCIPTPALDGRGLERMVIRYPVNLPPLPGTSGAMMPGVFEQDISRTKITEKVYTAEGTILTSTEMPNPIGLVYAVHIKNKPGPGLFGLDDVAHVDGLVQEMNDKISDVSDIIDYHSSPTTLVFGARVGALEKGANKVWSGLPKDARVENLHLTGDLSAMNTFIAALDQYVKKHTGVNDAALGGDIAISNTSGVALHMRFYSMLTHAELKWSMWRPQVRVLAEAVLRWGREMKQIEFTDSDMRTFKRALEITFKSNLPKDQLMEIQKNMEAVRAGLKSLRSAIADLGSQDPDGEMAQIEANLRDNPHIAALLGVVDPSGAGGKLGTGTNVSGIRNVAETTQTSGSA